MSRTSRNCLPPPTGIVLTTDVVTIKRNNENYAIFPIR
ncbi:hypothetical protein TSAR_014341 [Trichomalopsis sarcophagae]|uniref:Uncharacterized protein n=1 Tax=Trichomalopsis sarcophagae TaxID=543379 RepID=A0A232ERM3_9HYME|nr:hypothetical protein TSAR_014341 [Trichomalopsis sarcophagae]